MEIHLGATSVDHLDPLLSNFVCGLHKENNLRVISLNCNRQKSNAFVPYRIEGYDSPPLEEGDTCQFLIGGKWVWTSFCGEQWWGEATKIGYSRTNRRGSSWYTNGEVSKMILPSEKVPEGFTKGRPHVKRLIKHTVSPIKGKKRAYDPITSEDSFFDEVPQGYIRGMPPSKRNPGKLKEASVTWRKEVCIWYGLGLTTRQIAHILGLTAPTINRILKENCVTLRPVGGKRGKDLKPRKTDGYYQKSKPLDD